MTLSPNSILYLEDSDLDAELVLTRLEKSELPFEIIRASTRAEFETLLRQREFDLVLSDYQVPRFEGAEALQLARAIHPGIPFIFVSGAMGEELAVEMLKQGATDYVLKQRLARLNSAVERALGDLRERRLREASEQAVRDAQDRLQFAQAAAEIGAWDLNLETGELHASPICKENLGISPQTNLTRELLLELVVPAHRDGVRQALQQTILNHGDYDIEFQIQTPTGEVRWIYARGRYLAATGRMPPRLSGISLNITARKVSEERLRASEAQFRAIVEANPECVKLVAPDGTVLQMNGAGFQMIEVTTADQIIGQSIYPLIAPEFRETFRVFNERVCNGFSGRLEFDLIDRLGTRRHVETNAVPMKDPRGQYVQLAITRDITVRKNAENAMRQSEEQFRQLAETIANLAWMAHPDGSIFWYNSRWYEYTGTTFEQMRGWGWQQVHNPAILPLVIERWKHSLATGKNFEMEFPIKGADGRYRTFLTLIQPIRGADNKIQYWFGTNTDISSQKKTEVRLAHVASIERHRARLLSELAGASKTINAVLSVDSIIGVLAGEARRILRVHLAAVSVVAKPDQGRAQRAISMSEKYLEMPVEDRHERVDFILNSDLGQSVPLIGHSGQHFGTLQVVDKIDEEFDDDDTAILRQLANIAAAGLENARLYESLQDQDRRKDEFLATLAHELRNPLAPLRNALTILALDPAIRNGQLIDLMERQLSHMVRLIDDLLDISRISRNKMELRRARIQLMDVVNSAVETSRPLIESAGHELIVDVPQEPIALDGDLTRLAQVLSNLLSNSAKYTDRGQIRLSAVTEGQEVIICISDNGIGIPQDSLNRVFDMFWQVDRTLERRTGGLGIGLALVRGITEMHGGTITASSEGIGRGSQFTVRLPTLPADVRPSESASPNGKPEGVHHAGRRILVVDDNLDSAASMSMMLKLLGNDVATAHDGLHALEVVESFHPDIILMDVGMPRLNGYEATRKIRESEIGDSVKIVALTGWGQENDRLQSRAAGCDAHLVKPVSIVELETVLASFADDGAPQPLT